MDNNLIFKKVFFFAMVKATEKIEQENVIEGSNNSITDIKSTYFQKSIVENSKAYSIKIKFLLLFLVFFLFLIYLSVKFLHIF